MLGVRNYPQDYINGCRSRVEADLSNYRNLVGGATKAPLSSTFETFEVTFFNNMVLVLDHFFVHRLRTVEGKHGNPLNEVRILCDALMHNNGVMNVDKSIKLSPAKSVLQYQAGDEIKLNEGDFLRISKAFFSEIESRYL